MLLRHATAAVAFAGLAAASESASARGVGCPELPAYARAQGVLQMGEGACNMTKAEAMRILAQERPDLYGPAVQPSRKHRRHSAH